MRARPSLRRRLHLVAHPVDDAALDLESARGVLRCMFGLRKLAHELLPAEAAGRIGSFDESAPARTRREKKIKLERSRLHMIVRNLATPGMSSGKSFDLMGFSVGAGAAQALCEIGADEGVASFAGDGVQAEVSEVVNRSLVAGHGFAISFNLSRFAQIATLSLARNDLSAAGATEIARCLPSCPLLTSLDISANKIAVSAGGRHPRDRPLAAVPLLLPLHPDAKRP